MVPFMGKEDEISDLLFEIGVKRKVARVLASFVKTPAVTFREIGQDTGLSQPDVVTVMNYLKKQGWIRSLQNKPISRGRPVKIYELAKPMTEIMNAIEKEEIKKAHNQLQLIQKLRDCIR